MQKLSPPMISCVMPTKGRTDYLNQSIRYFLRQQYINKELIIVYDQPDDLPKNLILHSSITYYQMKENYSIGAKRSQGCSLSQGEIIAQWDDDDWYSADRLSVQAKPILDQQAELTALRGHCFYNLWEDSFWRTSPALYNMMFREGVAGGTLMFLKKLWLSEGVDYSQEYLREDADFMSLMLEQGARLVAVDGQEHFIYLRHLNNSWSFVSGKLLKPSEWYQTSPPENFFNDANFYQQLRKNYYKSYCQHDETAHTNKVNCILNAFNEVQLLYVLSLLGKQTYQDIEAIVLCYYPLSTVKKMQYQRLYSFPIKYLTIVDQVDHQKLSELMFGNIVMYWPEKSSWVSKHWLAYQVDFLIQHKLDLTGLAQPMYFFSDYSEFWQYIFPDNTDTFWLHPETLCYTRNFWHNTFIEKNITEPSSCRRMPHQHIEHFLSIEQGRNNRPDKKNEPRWFPYDLASAKDLFTDIDFTSLFAKFKNIGCCLLIGVILLSHIPIALEHRILG